MIVTTHQRSLLAVMPFRQTPGYCGPASVKMVLDFYGITMSELAIADAAGTSSAGTSAKGLIKAVRQFGYRAHIVDRASFAEMEHFLDQSIPVIVDWFSQDEGHYSVAVGLDDTNIYLQDPELAALRTLDRETFYRVWFDFSGPFISSPDEIILRRMIVIEKE